VEANMRMGTIGASAVLELLKKTSSKEDASCVRILTHCNTGSLATAGFGTAIGVITQLHKTNQVHVLVDETRPRLQGSRLTCWELEQLGIPHHLIVDGASGLMMELGKVDCVIFGADRCCANGDIANKIGTLNLSIVANAFNIPVFACVPTSTIDLNLRCGKEIPIEYRSSNEITEVTGEFSGSVRLCLEKEALNPAFDVTPNKYLSAIITEEQVIRQSDFPQGLQEAKQKADGRMKHATF